MKLRELKSVVDKAVQNAGDSDPLVEVWIGNKKAYRIARVGQFGFVKDLAISVGEKIYDEETK